MWTLLTIAAVVIVVAVLVDRRRRGPRQRGSGDDTFRDASYGEGAATAQSVRRPDTSGMGGGA